MCKLLLQRYSGWHIFVVCKLCRGVVHRGTTPTQAKGHFRAASVGKCCSIEGWSFLHSAGFSGSLTSMVSTVLTHSSGKHKPTSRLSDRTRRGVRGDFVDFYGVLGGWVLQLVMQYLVFGRAEGFAKKLRGGEGNSTLFKLDLP